MGEAIQSTDATVKFQESIKERLRSSIGDLMPDEVLAKLVQQAIQEMFFTRREESTRFGYDKVVRPSWFEDEVVKEFKSKIIDVALKEYIEKNQEKLIQMVTEVIAAKAPELLAQFFISVLNQQTFNIGMSLQHSFEERLSRKM